MKAWKDVVRTAVTFSDLRKPRSSAKNSDKSYGGTVRLNFKMPEARKTPRHGKA